MCVPGDAWSSGGTVRILSPDLLKRTRPGLPHVSKPEPRLIHVCLLLAGACLPIMGTTLMAPLLPKMAASFDGDVRLLVAIALSAPALVIGLLSPFAGAIVDRVGRIRPLTAGLVSYGAFGTAPLWLDSLQAIIVSRIGLGFAEAAIMTSCTVLIGDYFDGARRDKLLARQTAWVNIAAVLFVIVGGGLGDWNWRAPFWLYFGGWLLAIPMTLLLWEPTIGRHGPSPRSASAHAGPPGIAQGTSLRWRRMSGICAVSVIGSIDFFVVPVQLGFVLEGLGERSSGVVGTASGIFGTAVVLGTFVFTGLARRRVEDRLSLAFALLSVGLILLAGATAFGSVAVAAAVAGIGGGLLLPTLLTWAMRDLTVEQRGRGTGAWQGSFFIGQFLSPLVVAAIAYAAGGLANAVQTIGIAALVISVVVAVAPKVLRSVAGPIEARLARGRRGPPLR